MLPRNKRESRGMKQTPFWKFLVASFFFISRKIKLRISRLGASFQISPPRRSQVRASRDVMENFFISFANQPTALTMSQSKNKRNEAVAVIVWPDSFIMSEMSNFWTILLTSKKKEGKWNERQTIVCYNNLFGRLSGHRLAAVFQDSRYYCKWCNYCVLWGRTLPE